MNKKLTLLSAFLVTYFMGFSQVSLQITEIWPGNEPGSNLTSDWFEITNTGTTAWVSGVDADLFYDDDSQDPNNADIINGVTDIQPGEHVIIVIGNEEDVTEFVTVWGSDYNLTGIEIGYTDGSGLGGGGDGVTLFLGGPTTESVVDFQSYPDADLNGGQSYDVVLGAFTTVANNTVTGTTSTVNDEGQSAVASPGNQGPLAQEADLQITEIWSGNDPGSNLTSDWFEIKNNGNAAWTTGVDADLFYDDDSQDPSAADLIEGISDIQPGEYVIVVIGGASDVSEFTTVWGIDYDLTNIKIGYTDGSGLGGGGDGVTLFLDGPTTESIIDFETYPDTEANGGQSFDVEIDAFSTVANTNNAAATVSTLNDEGQAAIASPGNQGPLAASTLTINVDTALLTPYLNLSETNAGYVSGVVNDPSDPASIYGIPFVISDVETPVSDLVVTVSSNNQAVVSDANLNLSGVNATRLLTITPSALGFATITLSVQDSDNNTATYTINYAVSNASVASETSRFYTGASDGSTGIVIEDDYMWIGDDEDQTIRLYNSVQSGLPIQAINFNTNLGTTAEADLEGSFRIDNTIFWCGSTAETERSVIFTTNISGVGENSTLTYGDKYTGLHADILAWDANNDHGLGANYFNFNSAIEVEALALAPNSTTTAYLGIRSSTSENNAIVIPVTNFTSLPGMSAGSATFGAPILLDLNGRSLRSMECNEHGCILIGGPFNNQPDFKLYTWTGVASDMPELRSADLTALQANGSFEGIVSLPNSTFLGADGDTDTIELLVDLGATVIYNDGNENKSLRSEWKKFRSDVVALGSVDTPVINTPVINEFLADHSGADTAEFVEILGDPYTDYSNYTILEIEGDSGNTGVIDNAFQLGTTDENGLWTTSFMANTIENGAMTLLLVENYSGIIGDDIDTNDDGIINSVYWSEIIDGIATSDSDDGDFVYAVNLTPDFDGGAFQVGAASRIPNGLDTDSTTDWVRNDYDGEGLDGFVGTPIEGEALNTPNSYNQLVGPILDITEIWPGNGDGSNLTADWFEITNNGPITWTPAVGNLYFDDDSQDPASAVIINGITSIAPGETVVAIDAADTANFMTVWATVYNLENIQVGTYAGAGLSGGGDMVTLWIGDPLTFGNIVAAEAYPDTAAFPGQSYDVEKGGFSIIGEAPYTPVATAVNDALESAIGSPGNQGPALSVNTYVINETAVYAYPNPFNDKLNLQVSLSAPLETNITLVNTLGAVVYRDHILMKNGNLTLDFTTKLPSGIYILHIRELDKTIKVIKK
ncbi:T9SS type A sorting domain-containing protein [Bizionia sp. KMM 8389]